MEEISGVVLDQKWTSGTSTHKSRPSRLRQNPSNSEKGSRNITVEACSTPRSPVQLYKCKVCRKAYLKLSNLEKHEKSHEGQVNEVTDMATTPKSNNARDSQATTKSGSLPDYTVNIQNVVSIKQEECTEIKESIKSDILAQQQLNDEVNRANPLQSLTGIKGCTSTKIQTASGTGQKTTSTFFQVEQEALKHSETEKDVQKQVTKILDYLNSEDDKDNGSDYQKDGHTSEFCSLIPSAAETEVEGVKAESNTTEQNSENIAEKFQNIESGKDKTTLKEISENISELKEAGVVELFKNSRTTKSAKREEPASSEQCQDWSDRGSDFTGEKDGNEDAVAEPKSEEFMENKPFSCSICDEKFKNKSDMKSHRWKHSLLRRSVRGDEGRSCDVCHKLVKSKRALIAHKKTHSKGDKCEKCGKLFSSPSNLFKHKKTVHIEKLFMCDVCGASYKAKGHLTTHTLKVHDDKTYLCEECGKSFPHPSNLRKHIRTHAAIKSFICDICGRGFTFSGLLHRHMRTHSDEKPYKCITCGKCFRNSYNLSVHTRIHTMEKPFRCNLCPQAFNHNVSLQTHMKKCHV